MENIFISFDLQNTRGKHTWLDALKLKGKLNYYLSVLFLITLSLSFNFPMYLFCKLKIVRKPVLAWKIHAKHNH
jgi:hypothetical protein